MTRRHLVGSIFAGTGLGLVLGLMFAWLAWPTDFSRATPADLRSTHQDDYIRMIAAKYTLDGDLQLATHQLTLLGIPATSPRVAALAQTEILSRTRQALIHLTLDLQHPEAVPTRVPMRTPTRAATVRATTGVSATASPTSAARAGTPSPRPLVENSPFPPTALPNPNAPLFRLISREAMRCGQPGEGSLQVTVQDAQGRDVPGVAVEVTWAQGHEIFFTGLKPERGLGLADYAAEPGTYALRLTDNARSEVANDLTVEPPPAACPNPAVRGWRLIFRN